MLTALRRQLETESRDAISLLENPAENPICSIGFDEEAGCVVLVWKRYASSAQLRFANEVVLQTISARRAEKLLADDRALPTIHADDQAWVANQWMPRALGAGLRRLATVHSEIYFGRVAAEQVHAMAPSGLEIRRFEDPQAARAWLASA